MNQFHYMRSTSEQEALSAIAGKPRGAFLAGGTTIIDLMKLGVERPVELIDINRLPLTAIETLPTGGIRIGALARNSDVAHHPPVRGGYPMLSQAILSGATAQLRNMATVGGNIMQRTRCYYFRDLTFECNKRAPGTGCAAIDGFNRIHAILGTSDHCIAVNPSDMCVAMVALDAVVRLRGPSGERTVPLEEFHLTPGNTPERETAIQPGELITAVDVPASNLAANSLYLKLRDRASYEFALASVAVGVEMSGGKILRSGVAFGGVATKPWRARGVEKLIEGQTPSEELFARAAEKAVEGAQTRGANSYKVPLLKRAVVKALRTLLQGGEA